MLAVAHLPEEPNRFIGREREIAELRRLLAGSPGLRLLNSSREPLRIAAETTWPVPPAGDEFWTAVGLNLLAEIALHTGRAGEAAASADEALAVARAAGDGWNEGYALGTGAAIAAGAGQLREAEQLASASVAVMRRIDQQWGAARALLGLGDLARLRGHPGEAHSRYVEALPILQEIGARPEIARCLAGLGRVALDLGATGLARQHLAESLRLSQATGARIGVARGLEAFAALATREHRPELAVQLAAAASALRETAGLPPLPGARAELYLASARRLGDAAVARLWARGLTLSSEEAVALTLETDLSDDSLALTVVEDYEVAAAPPSSLTPREHQIAALVATGRSNKAIARELFISPTTAARHVANILAKLGFRSRTQIAAWVAEEPSRSLTTAEYPGPSPGPGALRPGHGPGVSDGPAR